MTDLEFLDTAEHLLSRIEASCDRINDETDADIDNQRVGGMITVTFANRSQIIVNLQKPLHEVWMAAKSGGYHFKYKDGQWLDTKGLWRIHQSTIPHWHTRHLQARWRP